MFSLPQWRPMKQIWRLYTVMFAAFGLVLFHNQVRDKQSHAAAPTAATVAERGDWSPKFQLAQHTPASEASGAATGPTSAATLELPARVQGNVGAFIKVAATTNGSQVRWVSMAPGLQVFPAELLKDSRTTVVVAQAEGAYPLLAYTAVGGEPSDPVTTIVYVGTAPEPEPGPIIPTPPAPKVPAPAAATMVNLAPLKTIMAKADKAKTKILAEAWADWFTEMEKVTPPATTANYRSAVAEYMNDVATAKGLGGAFPGFSAALTTALNTQFGNVDKALDPAAARDFAAGLYWTTQP